MKFGKKNKNNQEQITGNSPESGVADLTRLSKKDLLEIMLRQGEEIDALRAEVQELKDKLEAREIDISRVGTLAEASLAVTEIFKEADKAAMTYLTNLKRIAEGGMKK
jgi:AmiR/NasT family two-component response regulator